MKPYDLKKDAGEHLLYALDAFLSSLAEEGMADILQRGGIVALSGGADSVLLLHLARLYAEKCGIPLAAIHVHHGIRGEEADRDEAFCSALCARLGVRLFSVHEDVPAFREENGLGLEEAARRVRYNAFSRVLAENPEYACILTAHNATDNLETLILRLLRGSGLRGLCGIPPVRDVYLRPLLSLARRDIVAALDEMGEGYVTDSSNTDTALARNYVRCEILPRLAPLSADPEAAAFRLVQNLWLEERAAEAHADRLFSQAECEGRLSRAWLSSLERASASRVIARLYAEAGGDVMLEEVHYRALFSVLAGRAPARVAFPSGLYACLADDSLSFSREENEANASDYEISLAMGHTVLGEGCGEIYITDTRDTEFEKRSSIIYNLFIQAKINSATIVGGLTARNRRAGDRYRYGGMTRDVRRLMSGAHIKQALRDRLPLICDERGILWVPFFGVREDDAAAEGKPLYIYYCNGKTEK